MEKIAIVHSGDVGARAGYPAPACTFEGRARSQRLSPPDNPLWLVAARVEPGSSLRWRHPHGDQAIFVRSGCVELGHQRCRTGGVMVIEAGADAVARIEETSELVHVGSSGSDPPGGAMASGDGAGAGAGCHVIGPGGAVTREDGPHLSRTFITGGCPTCRISLTWSSHTEKYRSSRHSHSQDELIHVLRGELILGNQRVGPGDTLAVRAHTTYRFDSGDTGYGFLNYSPDASAYIRVRS